MFDGVVLIVVRTKKVQKNLFFKIHILSNYQKIEMKSFVSTRCAYDLLNIIFSQLQITYRNVITKLNWAPQQIRFHLVVTFFHILLDSEMESIN